MDSLKLTTDNQLAMMDYYNLSAEEVLLIEILFLSGSEERHKEYLVKYASLKNTREKGLRDMLISLQDKGIILKSYRVPNKGEPFDPESVEFNKNFLNRYRKYSGDLGAELLAAYPHFIEINGSMFDIANFAKKFNSEEDFYFAYGKAIGWKEEKHNEVLSLIEWAKKNTNYLNFNICDFVISKAWNRIAELKSKGIKNGRFDNIKTI